MDEELWQELLDLARASERLSLEAQELDPDHPAAELLERVGPELRDLLDAHPPLVPLEDLRPADEGVTPPIKPNALYSPGEVAEILGFEAKNEEGLRAKVHDIPWAELPRTPTGPGGGRIMFRGRDVLALIKRWSDDSRAMPHLPESDALDPDLLDWRMRPEPKENVLYTPVEAAVLLGFRGSTEKSLRTQVNRILYEELPRTPTGPGGGRIMFRGKHVIAYMDRRRRIR